MIQVAGGKCLGTLIDFYQGLGRYYHAQAGGFAYFKCWDPNWKAVRAHDDHFSKQSSLAPYLGKTLPAIYSELSKNKKMYYGYGTTAEECAKTFLASMGGTLGSDSGEEGGGGSGGTNVLELLKQAWSNQDQLGVKLWLRGDTLYVNRENPDNSVMLTPDRIINNSVSIQDYDNSTPNSYAGFKDQYLIDRYGEIKLEGVENSWKQQVLLVGQRGHGHSIDLKCIMNYHYRIGQYVSLSLPHLGIVDRKYMITKLTYDEEMVYGLTLESAPPSIYVEQQAEEESTEDVDSEASEEVEE